MDKKIYFIALTTYQLFVADVYSEYISKHYTCDVKIISVGLDDAEYSPVQGCMFYRIPNLNNTKMRRIWQRFCLAGRLFKVSELNKEVDFSGENIFCVFNNNEPITFNLIRRAKQNLANKIVLIEEGIGTYSYTEKKQLSISERGRLWITAILGCPMQYRAIGDSPLIDYAVVGNVELYESLEKAKKQIVIQQNKSELYKAALGFLKRYCKEKNEGQKADILYLGQPFDEFGRLLDEEDKCLEKLFNIIDKTNSILIKPHPRDRKDKYSKYQNTYKNIRVIEAKMAELPAECLINALGIKKVISFNSSAGVNMANSFQNIEAVFFYKSELFRPIRKYWNLIGAVYDDSIFCSKYSNTSIPIKNEEIHECLAKQNRNSDDGITIDSSNQFDEMDFILTH